jgi:flagellar protein FliJ
MARVKFRLAVVLRQRRRAEQECQRAVAERVARVVALQNELKQMDESVKSAADDLRKNHLTGAIDLNYLTAHRRYMNAMQQQGIALAQRIAAAQVQVNEARLKLAEAAKARKVIEKLRQRQFERWQADQAKRETAAMDEIGSQIGYANVTEMGLDGGSGLEDVEAAT